MLNILQKAIIFTKLLKIVELLLIYCKTIIKR